MSKFGYKGWGNGYGYGGHKRTWSSTSGWESSHYGGFTRIIYDYPYVKLDFKANIETPDELRGRHGIYTAEKLIKIYILKAKDSGYLKHLRREVVMKKPKFGFGPDKKFQVLYLDSEKVLEALMDKHREFAPLFQHYREDILGSSLEIEVKDEEEPPGGGGTKGKKGKGEGEGEGSGSGDGEGEEEGEGNGGGDGGGDEDDEGEGEGGAGKDGKGKNKKGGGWGPSGEKMDAFKELERILKEMQEQLPFQSFSSLGAECKPKFVSFKSEGAKERKFTKEEMRNAEMIIKQLDISFEPKSDEVKNLKMGKLDVSKIAEVPAGNVSVYKQIVEDQDTKPFAVCILADMSGSMTGSRLDTQFTVLNSLYLALSEIIPEEDLHIYGHSGSSSEPQIYTFCNPYSPNYAKNISQYYRVSNNCNYDGIVIEQVHKKIRERTDNPVILISLSDGQPCDSVDDMKKILERARRDQFVTVGIGIGTDYVKKLYTYSRIVTDEKIEEMPREVTGIINHVVKTEFK
jgi:hypothetical protein